MDTRRHRAVIRKLTNAIYNYLTLHLDDLEKTFKDSPNASIDETEMLVKAQDVANTLQAQIDAMSEACQKMPESIAPMFQASMVLPLKVQLESQQDWISKIQKNLEASAK